MSNEAIKQKDVAAFRDELVEANPAIEKYLPQMSRRTFFLLASTGLGKTVVMPVHLVAMLLEKNPDEQPQLWVVEPKVFIAQDQAKFLNGLWREFCEKRGLQYGPLFGCKTKVDDFNTDAPVVFCTTGIFSIYARGEKFRPEIDGVLIDEAHDTLETDQYMELGVALCRRRRVRVDFMSATVEESSVTVAFPDLRIVRAVEKRHAVWRHNTKRPMQECIVDVVRDTLIDYDRLGPYAPPVSHPAGKGVSLALTETGRSRGLLIIVTSYASENSDAQQVLRQLREAPYASRIEIALLSGETRRDPAKRREFDTKVERWKSGQARYVVIATSVVEMGVTLPNLDIIVSMDEGVIEAEDGSGLAKGPLGANAMMQRAGRVGRQRPGLHVITCDSAMPTTYSRLDDEALNDAKSLAPEAIRFPMASGSLTALAFEAAAEKVHPRFLSAWLWKLSLPSRLHETADGERRFEAELARLESGGVADRGGLSADGELVRRWLGRVDPVWAVGIVRAYLHGRGDEIVAAFAEAARQALRDIPRRIAGESGALDAVAPEDLRELFLRHVRWLGPLSKSEMVEGWRDEGLAEDATALGIPWYAAVAIVQCFDDALELLQRTAEKHGIDSVWHAIFGRQERPRSHLRIVG